MSLPLAGVRVLDLTRVLAGPFCSMLLADLGAEVIKIERPGSGDDTRRWGPPFVGGESSYFFSVNRNKKSVAINFQQPQGADLVRRLASKSDVLIENFVPGKLSRYGLSYNDLHHNHPSLIYCSVTGFGSSGPYAQRAGVDVIVSGMAGLMSITGEQDGMPTKVGVAMTDLATGLYAHGAIMAALRHRDLTGHGQLVECSLYHTQVACLIHAITQYLNGGLEPRRMGSAHASIVPYQAFRTKDGYIVVGATNPHAHFQDMCRRLDLHEVADSPLYATNEDRVHRQDEVIGVLSKRFSELTTADCLEKFDGASMPYGPIKNVAEVVVDPHTQHHNLIRDVEHPTAGKIRLQAPAVQYSGFQQEVSRAPPLLGQHTKEVLQSVLGLDTNELRSLSDEACIEMASKS